MRINKERNIYKVMCLSIWTTVEPKNMIIHNVMYLRELVFCLRGKNGCSGHVWRCRYEIVWKTGKVKKKSH